MSARYRIPLQLSADSPLPDPARNEVDQFIRYAILHYRAARSHANELSTARDAATRAHAAAQARKDREAAESNEAEAERRIIADGLAE